MAPKRVEAAIHRRPAQSVTFTDESAQRVDNAERLIANGESFYAAAYLPHQDREMTNGDLLAILREAWKRSRHNIDVFLADLHVPNPYPDWFIQLTTKLDFKF